MLHISMKMSDKNACALSWYLDWYSMALVPLEGPRPGSSTSGWRGLVPSYDFLFLFPHLRNFVVVRTTWSWRIGVGYAMGALFGEICRIMFMSVRCH